MSQLIRVVISTPSRHPANQEGYVPAGHHYRTDYVNPEFWVLNLKAIPSQLGPHFDFLPSIFPIRIPDNIVSFKWTVTKVGAPRPLKTIIKMRSPTMWNAEVQIPEQGEYEITLQVNLTNGEPEVHTSNYHLRDLLVVSIGDSFAAGQGNPDVTAIPQPHDKAICEATTLSALIVNVRAAWEKFRRKLEKETEEAIEDYLPFIGKIVVANVNQVQDIVGFVKGKIADLRGWAVDVVIGSITEGAEEAVSWLGFGDGGESEEVTGRPAGWQEPNAYRSYRSGHSLAARQVETDTALGADRITFLSFARTGSEIKDGLLGPRTVDPLIFGENLAIDGWTRNRGQIQEAKDTVLDRRIDALIISISINDLGFSTLTGNSIRHESGERRKKRIDDAGKKIKESLPVNLKLLKDAIESQLMPRRVFITEYPVGVFKEIETQGPCGVLGIKDRPVLGKGLLDLDTNDAKDLGRLGRQLNDMIRAKADEFGWVLIDGIERGFDGHGYCASRPYFVLAEESCLNQGDFEGMLHPNTLGHEVARDCIALALRRELPVSKQKWLEPVLNVMMR